MLDIEKFTKFFCCITSNFRRAPVDTTQNWGGSKREEREIGRSKNTRLINRSRQVYIPNIYENERRNK
jgi:hypothetical protein